MTAAVAPHLHCDLSNKNSSLSFYNSIFSTPQLESVSCSCSTSPLSTLLNSPLLDRKVGRASSTGLHPRRHSVSTPSSKFVHNQLNILLTTEPPGLTDGSKNKQNCFRERSYSETGDRLKLLSFGQVNSSRYKTELCRPYEESGTCKYGDKCQFAHGLHELRSMNRHPKYKTELCRTFHTIGFCPYGPRCHFVHNAEERRGPPPLSAFSELERPRLQHSCSFAGFPSTNSLDSPTSATPSFLFSREDIMEWSRKPFTYSSQDFGSIFGPSLGGHLETELPSVPVQPSPAPPSPTVPHFFKPVSESPQSLLDSLSDHEGYQSSQSGSESPVLDATRRLPIFSRLSISDE